MRIIKPYKIIIVVISLLVLVVLGVYGYDAYYKGKNFFTFYDSRNNVSLTLPKHWHEIKGLEKVKHSMLADFAFKKEYSDKSVITLAVVDAPGKNNLQIAESMQSFDENYPQQLKEFEKIDGQEIEIQGVKGLQYDFNYRSTGLSEAGVPIGGESITQRKIVFLKNEKMYYVDLGALKEDFEEELAEFEKIMRTLQVGK